MTDPSSVAPVLAAVTDKGGAGKSTVLACLAGHLAHQGHRVAVLDCDPTRRITSWLGRAPHPLISIEASTTAESIAPTVLRLQSEPFAAVLVDTAGVDTQEALFAMGCAHLVLIPCQPSEGDVTAAIRAHGKAQGIGMMVGRTIDTLAVLTRVKPNASIAAHARDQLAAHGVPLAAASIGDRVAYQELTYTGEMPRTGTAGEDIRKLVRVLHDRGYLPIDPPPARIAA